MVKTTADNGDVRCVKINAVDVVCCVLRDVRVVHRDPQFWWGMDIAFLIQRHLI